MCGYICAYTYVWIHMCGYICTYIHMYGYLYIYTHICIVCLRVYIYVNTYTYVYEKKLINVTFLVRIGDRYFLSEDRLLWWKRF